jgi:hypothetical protein
MATFLSESKRSFLRASLLAALALAIALVIFMQRGWLDWA